MHKILAQSKEFTHTYMLWLSAEDYQRLRELKETTGRTFAGTLRVGLRKLHQEEVQGSDVQK